MRLRLILLSPLLLLLVIFALSNRQMVPVGLWPTGLTLEIPLSAAILIGTALGFAAGCLLGWIASLPHRRRARRAEAQLTALQTERAAIPAIIVR